MEGGVKTLKEGGSPSKLILSTNIWIRQEECRLIRILTSMELVFAFAPLYVIILKSVIRPLKRAINPNLSFCDHIKSIADPPWNSY